MDTPCSWTHAGTGMVAAWFDLGTGPCHVAMDVPPGRGCAAVPVEMVPVMAQLPHRIDMRASNDHP